MAFVKVNGADYVRDTNSMGLSNTNITEKNEYYAKLKMIKSQKDEINILKQEINGIKSDVKDIKDLLRQLIGKE